MLISAVCETKVPFSEVREYYLRHHGSESAAHQRALVRLDKANLQFGSWVHTDVPLATILEVMLPHHTHRNTAELIPPQGLTAKEAYGRLKRIEKKYATQNPRCMATLTHANTQPIGTLTLAEQPVFADENYEHMKHWEDHLVSIDGLHRILSILYYGKQDQYSTLSCYIGKK